MNIGNGLDVKEYGNLLFKFSLIFFTFALVIESTMPLRPISRTFHFAHLGPY